MKRSTFIKTLLMAYPGLAFGEGLLNRNWYPDEGYDLSGSDKSVIVIGAGMAGLGAAHWLKEHGLNRLTVLEARNRVGGRTYTANELGFPVDLGASWIHGYRNANPLVDLAERAGATTIETDDDRAMVWDIDGRAYTDEEFDRYDSSYEELVSEIRSSGSGGKSFMDALLAMEPEALNNRFRLFQLSAYTEFDYGIDLSKLSSRYFDDDEAFGETDYLITNGYQRLAEYLARGLDVQLNSPVTNINSGGNQVTVTTELGQITADYVIVAVPLGVLKSGNLSFSPGLPPKLDAAISRMEMGSLNKVILSFPSVFWDNKLHYLGVTPAEKGKYNFFLNLKPFTGQNALMTFAFGDFAKAMESHTDEQVTADILANLKAIYGDKVPNPTEILRSTWSSEPYTLGSYSCATMDMEGDEFEYFTEPVSDKLFFAGEHTEQDYRGTVHGAYLSGIRAAETIGDLVDP